jgi:plasmid stabilization system protein ParE
VKYALEIAPVVYRDLRNIEYYIALDKPGAAKKVVKKLTTAIRMLLDNPFIAVGLRQKYGVDTDLMGLVIAPHIIIYGIADTNIKVYRVLDCRSDYLAALGFGTEADDSDDE